MTGGRRLSVLLLVAALLGGCGYSLRGNLPGHLKTVAVPVFKNRTTEPAVENLITGAVVEAFSTNGRLKVVRPEQADSILEGEVTGYQLHSIAFDPNANVRQYRLIVTLNLKFRDVRENEVLFQRSGYQEQADFAFPGAVAPTIGLEEGALRQAAVVIGRAIVSFTTERF